MSLEIKEKVYREMKKRFPDLRYNIFYPPQKSVSFECVMDVYNYIVKRFEKTPVFPLEEVIVELEGLSESPYSPQEILSALIWIASHSRYLPFLFLLTDRGEFLMRSDYSYESVFVTDELAEYGVKAIKGMIGNPLSPVKNWLGIEVNWNGSEGNSG